MSLPEDADEARLSSDWQRFAFQKNPLSGIPATVRNEANIRSEPPVQGETQDRGLRICFVSHSSNLQGAERALLELIDALRALGVKPYAILPSKGPFVDVLRDRGIECAVIPFMLWMGKVSPLWKTALRIASHPISTLVVAAQIRRWDCDLVYTNTLSVCVGALAARLLGRPHVWHIHEFAYRDHGMVFYLGEARSLKFVDRFSSLCIAVSHAVAQRYAPYISGEKLTMIYPSVSVSGGNLTDEEESPIATEGKLRCVIVGTLQRGKRQEDAIHAIHELAQLGIRAELLVVGDGDAEYRSFLWHLARECGCEAQIRFTGYVADPIPLIRLADVVLVCSASESFSRVTTEAMLLGKPVVGTRSGGTAEQISDGINGLLYPPGDAHALADGIKYFHDHPGHARHMGAKGRQMATERFGQDRYGAEVLQVLRRLVEQAGQERNGSRHC